MRTVVRLAAIVLVGAILAQLLMLWDTTGRRVFTFIPSDRLAQLQQQEGTLTGLFDDAAAPTTPKLPPINNTFGLGLLPAGMGMEAVSVTTLALPAMAVGCLAFCRGSRRSPAAANK
jgi:hypothetical protein